jgi:DNA-binding response OmpR family regulator
MSGETILLVDDEPNIIRLLEMYLGREGYSLKTASDGKEALRLTAALKPNLIVLDIMLPELDGLEVCRQIRADKNPVPIIMLTARDEDVDKIIGLELGADDYMTKPFNPRELVARVKGLFRRGEWLAQRGKETPIRIGNVEINPERRLVLVDDHPLDIRTQEFEVLFVLAQNRERVLTREQLLNLAWGYDFFGQTRTVDVHVAQLRRKLAGSAVQIETVTGVGYKLVG